MTVVINHRMAGIAYRGVVYHECGITESKSQARRLFQVHMCAEPSGVAS